jgi:ABC-type uncharacterized transport system substrate-binding protein
MAKTLSWRFLLFFPIFCVFETCFLILGYAQSQDKAGTQKKILLIHSYHEEYPWGQSITAGVKQALEGKNVDLEIFYMDTKRYTSDEFKIKSGQLAREKIGSWKPDAVITADDNAQIFVTQYYANKKPYFVFCGVNADPADYGFPASNVTGIIERPQFAESLAYLDTLVKNVKKIAIMSDNEPTSVGTLNFMRKEKSGRKVMGYNLITDLDVWKSRVFEYNKDLDALCIYTYHTLQQPGAAVSVDPSYVIQWTIENCKVPTVGFLEFAIESGVFCGVVESGKEHGYEAAVMALELIGGADIKALPVKKAEKGLTMINLKTARQLGITVPEEILKRADKVFE